MGKSAYQLENKRSELAVQGRLSELKQTYTAKNPEIKDENTSRFWNEKLASREPLTTQDGMTRDRTKIAAHFLPLFAKRILDIGIGHGWVEELLEKRRELQLYGVDISDETIQNIKRRFQGEFSVQSIYSLSFGSSKLRFDAILLLEVLEHVPPSKTFTVLRDIWNLLLPGGYLILSVPTNEGLDTMPDNPSGHVRMYTVPLIAAELELAGFKVIQLKTLYAFRSYYTFKKILAHIFRNRWQPNDIVILAQKQSNNAH